jgi:ketosteroid isomerase-like protein
VPLRAIQQQAILRPESPSRGLQDLGRGWRWRNQKIRLSSPAFEAWAKGEGDFFRLLADDELWTITGSSPVAGTYASRQAFLDGAIQPIAALWHGHAVAKDGEAYDNRYCWVMRFEDGKVKEADAFFDSPALTDLFERVAAEER